MGCGKSFVRKSHLERHQSLVHPSTELTKPFECSVDGCEKAFSLAHQLKRHIGVHEKPPKLRKVKQPKPASPKRIFKCDETGCDFQCESKVNLGKHMKSVHVKPKAAEPATRHKFRCGEIGCGKLFTTSFALDKHIQTVHLDLRPFECRLCQSAFGHKHLLARHMKRYHENADDEPQSQPEVPADEGPVDAASIIAGLSGLTYEAERPFACPDCRRRYFRQYDLDRHKCN